MCCSKKLLVSSQVVVARPQALRTHMRRGALVTSHLTVAFWPTLHLFFQVGMLLRRLLVKLLADTLPHSSAARFMTCRHQLGAGCLCS